MLKSLAQKSVLVSVLITLAVLTILGLWQIPRWQVAPLEQRIKDLQAQIKTPLPPPANKQTKAPPAPSTTDLKEIAALEKGRIDSENTIRTSLFQAVGGLLVFITLWISWRTLQANEAKQVAERFSKAVEQLGNDKNIHVRLGGIYALEQIAKDAEEKYYWQVMETLTSYVRVRSPWEKGNLSEDSSDEPCLGEEKKLILISTDDQEALKVLERCRKVHKERAAYVLNLSEVDLCCLQLPSKAQLCKVDFSHSNLQEAFLPEACLERANLAGANLKGAFLYRANLRGANLRGANLQEAILIDADLTGATLSYAILRKALLWKANLKDAELSAADLRKAELGEFDCPYPGVDLQGTEFREFVWNRDSWLLESELGFRRFEQISNNIENTSNVIFKGADLSNTTLKGAKLMEAKLQGAVFDGADLQYADLRRANVKEASFKGAKLKEAKFRADQQFVKQHKMEVDVVELTWDQLDKADFYKKNCLPNHLLPGYLEAEAAQSAKQVPEPIHPESEMAATPPEETP